MKIIQGALSLIVLERAAAADGRLRKPGHSTVAKRMAPADASLPDDGSGLEETEFWASPKDSGDASDECPHYKIRRSDLPWFYCLFGVKKYIFSLFSFLCLVWHVIERYG